MRSTPWIIIAVAGSLAACSASTQKPFDTRASRWAQATTLTLEGDGNLLRLRGSPLEPSYAADYPVPGVAKMVVQVKGGELIAKCWGDAGGDAQDCSDLPFFAQVEGTGNTQRLHVFDVMGAKVIDVAAPNISLVGYEEDEECGCADEGAGDYGGTSSVAPGGEAPGSGTTGSGTPSNNPGESTSPSGSNPASGAAPDGGSPAGSPGSGTTDGTGPGRQGGVQPCTPQHVAQVKADFCKGIDLTMLLHAIPYKINCSALDLKVIYGNFLKQPIHVNVACMDLIQVPYAGVQAALGLCPPNVRAEYVNWQSSSRFDLILHGACRGSPLVLDLDGDGIHLSDMESGVPFDLLGTGTAVRSAWTTGGDALLALDRNANGTIDGVAELFGSSTHEDGFLALGELDANGDAVIDRKDPVYPELLVWVDRNRDGVSQSTELRGLGDANVRSLSLRAKREDGPSSWDSHGNAIPLVSHFVRKDGSHGALVDAFFRFAPSTP